jgi:hypothetical protein
MKARRRKDITVSFSSGSSVALLERIQRTKEITEKGEQKVADEGEGVELPLTNHTPLHRYLHCQPLVLVRSLVLFVVSFIRLLLPLLTSLLTIFAIQLNQATHPHSLSITTVTSFIF